MASNFAAAAVRFRGRRTLRHGIAALLSGVCLGAVAAHAQNATWQSNPTVAGPVGGTFDFNANNNWTPAAVPTGTAFFGASNGPNLSFSALNTTLGGFTFNAGAPNYTFTIVERCPGLCTAQAVSVTGAGVVNNSTNAPTFTLGIGGTLTFQNAATAANANIVMREGSLVFQNTSTAGSATVTAPDAMHIGTVTFKDSSSAGTANFTMVGSTGLGAEGTVFFLDTSTAANATFTNNAGIGSGGITQFGILNGTDSSNAGAAHVTNNDQGTAQFFAQTSAMNATIINNNGGGTNFQDQSTAGNAQITNNAGGFLFFGDQATAGSASITNNAGGFVDFGFSGLFPLIIDTATAGNATIINNGTLTFNSATTAGNATITTNGGGNVFFFDASTGGNARFITNAGGTFDMSGLTSAGMTAGSIEGAGSYVLGSKQLTIGSNNLSTTVSGVLSGIGGSLIKIGSGNFNLTGTNTYTGPTLVNGGTLSVNGSIVTSSGVTVNAGGTLGGNGQLPSVTFNGGTLAPGNSIGTISINGNLVLNSAATYMVEVSPTAADRTNVTGTASLAGTVQATFASGGGYITRTYTILSASGGRSGTFGVFTATGFPTGFLPSLSYTGTDVILNLTAVLGQTTTTTTTTTTGAAPPSVANTSLPQNQFNVATAINNVFNSGGALPADFAPLFGLTGGSLSTALSQLSGETATGIAPAGLEAQNRFLMLMLDPFAGVGEAAGATSMRATSFATDAAASDDLTLGYAGQPRAAIRLPVKAPPLEAAAAPDRRWSAWAATYGSESRARGDATVGSHDRDVRTGNIASGFDYRFSPDTTIGFAFSGGSASYGLSDGLGSGRGDVYQAGAYVASRWQSFYVAASAALSRYELTEGRTIAFPGALSALSGNTAANAIGARFEAGKRYDYAGYGVTPYVALQTQSIRTPGFNEAANAGSSAFALSYAAQTTTRTRSEIGLGADHRVGDFAGGNITGFGRAAWGHDFSRDAAINPAFAALPGTSFNIQGAQAAGDSALLSAGLLWANTAGWSLRLKGDGEFAGSVTTYAGNATVRYVW